MCKIPFDNNSHDKLSPHLPLSSTIPEITGSSMEEDVVEEFGMLLVGDDVEKEFEVLLVDDGVKGVVKELERVSFLSSEETLSELKDISELDTRELEAESE